MIIDKFDKKFNIQIVGKGDKAIILCNGYGCNQSMWRHISPHFMDDYEVVMFDHLGMGNSNKSLYKIENYNSLQDYARDLLEIIDNLELENVILVGHSVSAMICMLAAIEKPAYIDKIIMICPSPCYKNTEDYQGGFSEQDLLDLLEFQDKNYLGWSSNMAPVIMGNPDKPELASELENNFCQNDPVIAKHFAKLTFLSDNRIDLPNLQTETLLLQCSRDSIAPPTVGEYLRKKIPNNTFLQLSAQGHCPHLSYPQEVIGAIKTFLA